MPVDWGRLRTLADEQRDLLTRRQCLGAGMSPAMLDWRVSSGRWARVYESVFQTKPGRDDPATIALAALLRASSGALAADAAFRGRSAGFFWGFERNAPADVDLVVPQRRSVRFGTKEKRDGLPRVRIRRSMRWDNLVDDMAYPWRTTRPVTILDLANGSEIDALSVVARAVQKEFVTTSELLDELVARGGHKHSRLLRLALLDVEDGAQSGAEVLYVRDVERAHELPPATRQASSSIGSNRLHDNEYPEQGLIVEVDGRLGHEMWSDRVRDGRRDRQLLTGSRVTTRVFFADVALTPCRTAREVAAILHTRGWSGMPRRCRRPGCQVFERETR